MNNILLCYYAVWYLAHKNSKYAKDFSHYWYSAFLQVVESLFAVIMIILVLLTEIFDIRIHIGKFSWIILFAIIPGLLLYYLIFHIYKVDKNAEDADFDYLRINKTKKIAAWSFYIFINFLMLFSIYLAS